ncbi:MAG: hypothetical protein ACQESR_30470, partial [Planctomycetota bacterium]
AVYWFDDRPRGRCRVPQSWTLWYHTGHGWAPITPEPEYGTARDQYNRATFDPVTSTALRLEIQQQPGMSSGILEWKVNGKTPALNTGRRVGGAGESYAGLSYAETWLVLSRWVAVQGKKDSRALRDLGRLRELVRSFTEVQVDSGLEASQATAMLRETAQQLAELKKRYAARDILSRLQEISPDQCLKLMIQLDWLRQDSIAGQPDNFLQPVTKGGSRSQNSSDDQSSPGETRPGWFCNGFLVRACHVIDELSRRASRSDDTLQPVTKPGFRFQNALAGGKSERFCRGGLRSADLGDLRSRRDSLLNSGTPSSDSRWMELYLDACDYRRRLRMGPHVHQFPVIVFTKHHDIGGQHYAYTEDISDSPYDDNNPFPPSGKLCLLEMDGVYGSARTVLDEPDGLIRDPAVSYDGERILFAWRESMTEDDYHLYEMRVEDEEIRQLTFGEGVADYEAAYLPGGDIVFNSSRCQQIVDCWWSDVSNLYTCDGDGRYLRRLGFDQVHTNYPQVMPDGRVIYTRWDYNDRGQLFPQPLFQMNPDGTAQREFYGNNSWFPTTILHARGIPGTTKVLCVLSGHHTYQKGKLAIIDRKRGRQENAGVQLVAPIRRTEAVRIDKYGHEGEQFQYPYPLSETEFLVTYSSEGSEKGRAPAKKPFGIYFMTVDGRRELLAADPGISCNQPVPLVPRPEPRVRSSPVDHRKKRGTYYLQDIHVGPGLEGVPRGTIKKLRVVGLEFRAAGVGSNRNKGPAGGALVSTPISINGSWDVKRILGTARVYPDGSACFQVPARTPVYFQALNEKNQAVQTMRSWSTLQPGETFSCVGCHESKDTLPALDTKVTLAMQAGPQDLTPFYGPPRGFSFAREIQPILDEHCVKCHNRQLVAKGESPISLAGTGELDRKSLKRWSDAYKALANREYCNWVSPQSAPPMLAPYHAGAVDSGLIELLEEGHEGVKLSQEELDKIACWIDLGVPFCGDYTEAMDPARVPKYEYWLERRQHWQAEEAVNLESLIEARAKPEYSAGAP